MAQQAGAKSERTLIDSLWQDHMAVKDMLKKVGAPGTNQSELFCELVHDLVAHEVSEEEIVYPVVRRSVENGDRLADARIKEQQEAEELLLSMEKMDGHTPEFVQSFQHLKEAVLAHASHEETEVFPLLETSVDASMLVQLGKAYSLAKRAAPTHPHPHAPNTPPGNVALGPVVALMDRGRDAARSAAEKVKGARSQ